jgi:hypothetical protein
MSKTLLSLSAGLVTGVGSESKERPNPAAARRRIAKKLTTPLAKGDSFCVVILSMLGIDEGAKVKPVGG